MQCPGQDNRYWDGDAVFEIPCPHCGNILEFFKDDSQRSCKKCGHRVLNPKIDFGCASYCPYAEQCLGAMPKELLAKQGDLFKDRLAVTIRKKESPERYQLAAKRGEYAELICREEQGNMAAVVAAALLADREDWREILTELKAEEPLLVACARIIERAQPTSREEEKADAIFHDACLLADLNLKGSSNSSGYCLTDSGKELLKKL